MLHPSCHDEIMLEGERRWKAHGNTIRPRAGINSVGAFRRDAKSCDNFLFPQIEEVVGVLGTFRGVEAGTRAGGGFASGVVGQSPGRGYGSCRTLVRSSRERAAERREALPEKGRPVPKSAGRRAG